MKIGDRVVVIKECLQVRIGWVGEIISGDYFDYKVKMDDGRLFHIPKARVMLSCTNKVFYNRYDLLDLIFAINKYGVDVMKEEIENCKKVSGSKIIDGVLFHKL